MAYLQKKTFFFNKWRRICASGTVWIQRVAPFILQIKNHLSFHFSEINMSSKVPHRLPVTLKFGVCVCVCVRCPCASFVCVCVCVWSVLMCREGEAVSPHQTDGYQHGSREGSSAALHQSQEVKLQSPPSLPHSLLFFPSCTSHSVCVFLA